MNQEPGNSTGIQWKWGGLAALAIMLLALWRQMNIWIARASNWQGSYVAGQVDEVAYSMSERRGKPPDCLQSIA